MGAGVRTIAVVKSIWSTIRVRAQPTNSRWIISRKMNLSNCLQSMTSYSGRKFGGKFWGENRWVDWISETKGDVLWELLFYLRASFSFANLDPSAIQNAVWMGKAMVCQKRVVFPVFSGVCCAACSVLQGGLPELPPEDKTHFVQPKQYMENSS